VGCAFGGTTAVWVTLIVLGARADGTVLLDITVGTLTTRVTARVHADIIPASHVVRTIGVPNTLGFTASQRIADVVVDTGADGAVVPHLAISVGSARAR